MNRYGKLVEQLINIKDTHRGELSIYELEIINEACCTLEREGANGN